MMEQGVGHLWQECYQEIPSTCCEVHVESPPTHAGSR
jgi:hypothetical protein